jgi:hypothetical protein
MTNVKHKFLIYLSVYFRLTSCGISINQSSETGVQRRQRSVPGRWHQTQEAWPAAEVVHLPLKIG